MLSRKSTAIWEGTIGAGKGQMAFGSGAYVGNFSVPSRFDNGEGTNPEELIAAAHAGCFSMAFSAELTKAGFNPEKIETIADVQIEKLSEGWRITKIHLETSASIPDIDETAFQTHAINAKNGCPISNALAGVSEITLKATLA
jgi:lipoyl-dependent peroxiredoxin